MDQSLRDATDQASIDALSQSLRDVAKQGNIDALYTLIGRDAKVLDWFDEIPFVDTPLHIAASAGHTLFAKEIMRLKPSFARKLNQNGFTPMHLVFQKHHDSENDHALQRNLTQLVHGLLDVAKDLVCVQGREGVTPLHYAAQTGNVKFLALCLKFFPESIKDVTIRGENVLHIALKYDRVEAFLLLMEWVRQTWLVKDALFLEKKLLCWQDEEGNTLFHVAVSKVSNNLPKVVSSLMDTEDQLVDINAKNSEGHTVFDILEQHPTLTQVDRLFIKDKLRQRRPHITFWQRLESQFVMMRRLQTVLTDEKLNALLIFGALLITVTFQAALTPPKSKQNLFLLFNSFTYCLTTYILVTLFPLGFVGKLLHVLLLFLFACFCVSTLVITTHHIIFVVLSVLFGYTFCYLFAYVVQPCVLRVMRVLIEFKKKYLYLRRDR